MNELPSTTTVLPMVIMIRRIACLLKKNVKHRLWPQSYPRLPGFAHGAIGYSSKELMPAV